MEQKSPYSAFHCPPIHLAAVLKPDEPLFECLGEAFPLSCNRARYCMCVVGWQHRQCSTNQGTVTCSYGTGGRSNPVVQPMAVGF